MQNKVFVYGTLMEGMVNHAFLENSKKVKDAEIEGFDMYFLGHYPGVVEGKGRIKGEIYEVSDEVLMHIDELEGEGTLYTKKQVKTTAGDDVYLYVYNYSVEGKPALPYEMQPYNKLVFYVAYGSNMLERRFSEYINGCNNKNLPVTSIPTKLNYNMYYSKESKRWNDSSVCFLDDTKVGFAYGRAYLITQEQFEEIQKQECGNKTISSTSWYGKVVNLGYLNGMPMKTFTYKLETKHKSFDTVGSSYVKVLIDGLKETHNLTENEALKYLEKCGE